MKASSIGIGTNVMLAIFKAIIGFASNSVAIILDAINNLSDALSSILTIVGTKLAAKPANKKHPYGYGRMEYITSIVVAAIVLAAGISSLISSGQRIFEPEEVFYSKVTVIIVLVGIVVKYLLGRYVKKIGNDVNSKELIASGTDASFDALISTALWFLFFWRYKKNSNVLWILTRDTCVIYTERKLVTFDVVIDLTADNAEGTRSNIEKELNEKYTDFTFMITYDTDYSD